MCCFDCILYSNDIILRIQGKSLRYDLKSSYHLTINLGELEIDVVYFNGWVAIYQFIVTILLIVPGAYGSSLTWRDIPNSITDGASCYVGTNTITYGETPDDCHNAPFFVNTYLFFNVVYNVLIIMILKYGSSNLLWLAMTLMVPLVRRFSVITELIKNLG